MPDAADGGRSDDDLAEAARTGDLSSFNLLVRRYQRSVYWLCVRELGRGSAEDAAQDAFVRAWQRIEQYRGGNFAGWMHAIARNRCRDEQRRRQRRPTDSLDQLTEGDDERLGYQPPDPSRSPETQALDSETGRALLRAMAQLPADQRDALQLRELQDLSYEQIAGVMETSVGTVKSRISRARAAMRQLLIESGELSPARERLAREEQSRGVGRSR